MLKLYPTQLLRRTLIHRALLALFLALIATAACSQAPAGPALSAVEALEKTQAGQLTLIDIRTPAEWRTTGVAVEAKRIDMKDPKGPAGFADRVLAAVGGDTSAPIALICRTGNRSGFMQRQLLQRGFTNVYNVAEGMAGSAAGPGWIRRGLPITPCPQC